MSLLCVHIKATLYFYLNPLLSISAAHVPQRCDLSQRSEERKKKEDFVSSANLWLLWNSKFHESPNARPQLQKECSRTSFWYERINTNNMLLTDRWILFRSCLWIWMWVNMEHQQKTTWPVLEASANISNSGWVRAKSRRHNLILALLHWISCNSTRLWPELHGKT